MTLVDIIIVLVLLAYVLSQVGEGFLALSRRLIAFFGAAVLAFMLYSPLAKLLGGFINLTPGVLEAASFIGAFLLIQALISELSGRFITLFPREVHPSEASKILATIPALIDGLIVTALTLLILVVLPVLPQVKQPIEESRLGSALVNQAAGIEIYVDKVFGQASRETLGFLTVRPENGETVDLPFQVQSERLSVDEEAEVRMLELINMERKRAGLEPLVMDPAIVPVARAHSEDMWERRYFAHENPDGETPFDRMRQGGVRFAAMGENLALARTVERAHNGLMKSPGHRRNILDPVFTRVGIGVIDGGIYGKMFTQNFAD